MSTSLFLELTIQAYDTEIDRLLEQIVICRKQQWKARGELNRARRLEREELQRDV